MNHSIFFGCLFTIGFLSCKPKPEVSATISTQDKPTDTLRYEKEKHLANMRQLTFGGDNAEAYWSFKGDKLTFQASRKEWNAPCDQIFIMDTHEKVDTSKIPQLISTGFGRTTCSYFLPGDTLILFASTHKADKACPPTPERNVDGHYVWPLYPTYDIYVADLHGQLKKTLVESPGYDAEATVSPKGDKIVFTSTRSGDPELYTMDIDGKNVKQVTNGLGYDGGAFFSHDGTKLVFRASRPTSKEDVATYKALLAKNLVQPTEMELFTCNVDGSDLKQITHMGQANWAPYFLPSDDKIIFCSNYKSEHGFPFNLYIIGVNGEGLEQITYDTDFDSFPMFSPDGKRISFSSNRNNGDTRATNVFVADWIN
jgi:Tol biopolymer transport system component